MNIMTKGLMGAGAAAVALVSTAAPAEARDRYRDRDGISAGEVIAGAVVLGGLAAVIASADNDRYDDRYDDYRYRNDDYRYRNNGRYNNGYNYDYRRNGNSRQAISACVNQVEGWAGRYSRSDVTQIRDIDRTRYGYRVKGNLVVRDGWRGNNRYDRYDRGYDQGRFTCTVERGRVVDIDYNGLDRWR